MGTSLDCLNRQYQLNNSQSVCLDLASLNDWDIESVRGGMLALQKNYSGAHTETGSQRETSLFCLGDSIPRFSQFIGQRPRKRLMH